MKNVLVLCVGNACRSQMAEGYLNYYAKDKAQIYSAGLEEHGLHQSAVKVMAEDSIDISHHFSKLFTSVNHIKYDYLITICDISNVDIPSNLKWDKVYNFNIDDPAATQGDEFTKLNKFRETREQIKKSILHFIGKELTVRPKEEAPAI